MLPSVKIRLTLKGESVLNSSPTLGAMTTVLNIVIDYQWFSPYPTGIGAKLLSSELSEMIENFSLLLTAPPAQTNIRRLAGSFHAVRSEATSVYTYTPWYTIGFVKDGRRPTVDKQTNSERSEHIGAYAPNPCRSLRSGLAIKYLVVLLLVDRILLKLCTISERSEAKRKQKNS